MPPKPISSFTANNGPEYPRTRAGVLHDEIETPAITVRSWFQPREFDRFELSRHFAFLFSREIPASDFWTTLDTSGRRWTINRPNY
jgi:hypothetical protein